jgi:hypothetical protein
MKKKSKGELKGNEMTNSYQFLLIHTNSYKNRVTQGKTGDRKTKEITE